MILLAAGGIAGLERAARRRGRLAGESRTAAPPQ
jgi:hypothetical protein